MRPTEHIDEQTGEEGGKKVVAFRGSRRSFLVPLLAMTISSLTQNACLPSCEEQTQEQARKTVPLPPEPKPSLRTFTDEELAEFRRLNWSDDDINKAKEYQQEFEFTAITWLSWGKIAPAKANEFLKIQETKARLQAIKDRIKTKYDDRFSNNEKEDLMNAQIEWSLANAYPKVLPASTIIEFLKKQPPILPKRLSNRWNDEDLKFFINNNVPIEKTIGYSERWKAEDVAEFVKNEVPNNQANAYPTELNGKEVVILWTNAVNADITKRGLERVSKEDLLTLATSGENTEEALKFPCTVDKKTKAVSCRFTAKDIIRILKQGYSADYVTKYDEKFPDEFVAFFAEHGISYEEANANFPKRLHPISCLAIREQHKDFPLRVIDDYPKDYNADDLYAAAMAGMGVGYANAYPARFLGKDAVLLWKNHIFGEEASTYAYWLDAEQILLLKQRGVTGSQTQKYRKDYPLEDIIAQERRKSR